FAPLQISSSLDFLGLFLPSLYASSQPVHRCSHSFALTKNPCSGHQNVSSGGNCQRSSFCIDAPVHLQIALWLNLLDHLTDTPDLWQGGGEEMLMPEAGVDSHDQHLLNILQDFLQHRGRGCRVYDHSSPFTQCLDALYGTVQIAVAFPVNEERIRAGLDELVQEQVRIRDHQVNLQRQARHPAK